MQDRTFGANHWRLQAGDTITGLEAIVNVVQARLAAQLTRPIGL